MSLRQIGLAAVGMLASALQSTPPSLPSNAGSVSNRKTVAITVDDLPGAVPGSDKAQGSLLDLRRWNCNLIRVLHKHNAPATGLVIGEKMEAPGERDARAEILREWLRAGLDLGNHTYSHLHFSTMSIERFEDDTLRGDVVTRAVLAASGRSERYFRHPGLSLGSTPATEQAFESFLKERGYEIAPVSIEDADYQFNDVLADALASGDDATSARVKALYFNFALSMFDYVERASQQVFGRQVPQVLLIHDNAINAEELDALLTDLEKRGYSFVPLETALRDPAYGSQSDFAGNLSRCYLCWGDRLRTLGKTPQQLPVPPFWIGERFQTIRKASGDR